MSARPRTRAIRAILEPLERRILMTGNATQLVYAQQPSNVTAGAAENPFIVVDVEDQNGSIVTTDNSTVMIALASGPGSVSGTLAAASVNGVATFSNVKFNAGGNYTLTASDGGLTSATSNSFTVTAPTLAAPSGLTATASGSSSVALSWTDNDNSATGYTILRSVNGDSYTTLATLNDSNSASICTFTFSDASGDAGTITLNCVPSGLGDGSVWATSGSLTITSSSDTTDVPLGVYPLIADSAPSLSQSPSPTGAFNIDNLIYPGNNAAPGGSAYLTDGGILFGKGGGAIEINIWGNGGGDYAFYGGYSSSDYPITVGSGGIIPALAMFSSASSYTDSTVTVGNTYAYEVVAFNATGASVPSASTQVTILGPASKLVYAQQPSNVTADVAENPSIIVDVEDQYGNIVTTDNSTVTLAVGSGPGSANGTLTATAVNGLATFSNVIFNTAGNYTLTASDGSLTSATSISFAVNPDGTTSAVTSSANPSVFGESDTFTATVTANAPGSGIPTGMVTFLDGSATLGTETLNSSGVATFSTSALTVGSHSITVVYGGDTDFITSASAAVTQVVDQDGTTSLVVSSANPSVFGQSVTFTATVIANAPGSGIPAGTVTFMDGSTTLGAGTLDGSGIATFQMSGLVVGSHSITAVYGGDTDFTASTSSASSQTVNQDATTSVVASSANPSVFGQSVALTATINANSPGSGIPTGSVTFYDGATILGNGLLDLGIATFSTSNLALGSHSISAVYNGSGQYLFSTSSACIQTVNAPVAIKLMISDQPATLTAGETGGALVVDITNNNGTLDPAFNSAVAVSIVSGPAGAKLGGTLTAMASNGIATFSDLQITQQGTYVLEISTNGITAETAPITITAGPPSQLGVTVKPSVSWQFGSISPGIVVDVTDQYGNLVTAGNPTVTAAIVSGPVGAVLYGTLTVPATNGYALFRNLSLNLPGMYGLAFSSGNKGPVVVDDLEIVGIPARRYLFNGLPLSGIGILMQQQRNAPATINDGPPVVIGSPQVMVLSGPTEIAAANFSDEMIAGSQLFGANNVPETGANSVLEPGADSLWNFLEST